MATHTLGTAILAALDSALGTTSNAIKKTEPRKSHSPATKKPKAPVLRNSVEAGTFEDRFFSAPAKGETDRILRAARRILDAGRQLKREARAGVRILTPTESLITTLTSASVRVLEEILTLSRLNAGKVFPSYEYLTQATSLGRATVARALTALEQIGFLVRQRRFKRLENADGPGPRYEQTSNVYRAFLPKIIKDYLPRWMHPAPPPEDTLHHTAEQSHEMQRMQTQLTCQELAESNVGGMLGKALASLGAALDRKSQTTIQRESQNHTETLIKNNYNKQNKPISQISVMALKKQKSYPVKNFKAH